MWEEEGVDRLTLNFTNNDNEIVQAAAAQCNNTVVIVHTSGPTILESFVDHPNVTAILMPLYPGEQSGR